MLEKLFVSILNMSLIGSYAIVFVLIARLLLKKAPKIFSYALWSIVLFRLICPFSFESVLSLMPTAKAPIPQDIIDSTLPQINTGIDIIDHSINPILPGPNLGDSANPIQIWIFIGTIIWVLGMLAMLIYSMIAFVKLKRSLIGSAPMKENIYLADHISSPFVMGLIRPKIYLPSSLSDSEKDFITTHEICHIKRFDHITRILGFAALLIHWFNPLVWLAFILSGKDMELSCDEAVMKKRNTDIRAEYSQSLLRFATGKKMLHATPLAFGEGDTKSRVKNVMNYKKPAFWVIVVSVIAVVAVGVGLLANPKNNPILIPKSDEVSSIRIEQINEGESLGVVEVVDRNQIETILKALQNTNKTMQESVNDPPNRNDYFQININGSDSKKFYLYNDGEQYFVEEPYDGIYKTSRETSLSIAKIYTPLLLTKEKSIDKLDSYSISNLKNGDIQLSINNTIEFSELGSKNEGFAYFEKATNQLHVGITTAFGQPKSTDENPVGSLAGAKLEFDMDIKAEKLLKKSTPYNSENVRLEISDEATINIGKKLYKKALELSSVQNPSYNILTVDNGPVGVPFKVNKNNELDTLQMLAELDKSNNKFKAEMVMSDDKYIKFDFTGDKKLKSIYLRYIASVDDIWQKEYPIDKEYKIKLPTKTGIYSFFADIIWENGDSETAYFGITVGNPPPLPLTKETATECINQTLSTFKLNFDNTVSFTLPSVIPTDESGKTKLYISSSATFSSEPGTSSVQEILDMKDGFQGGESYTEKLDVSRGKLTQLFLRVAFMTAEGENSYREYAANYIEFTQPFKFDTPVSVTNKSIEISHTGKSNVLKYTMQNGDDFSFKLELPKGLALSTSENYPQYAQVSDVDFSAVVLVKDAKAIGSLTVSSFGTDDIDALKQVDASENVLPMAIFSPIAMSNHAEFKNYKVVKSSSTGANATAKYLWQDLTDYGGKAPEAPWLKSDSILVYDYEKMPFFINLNLTDGSLSAHELENLAKSIVLMD